MTLDQISCISNRIVDFGPPLVYPAICKAYTVEKMALWKYQTESLLELVIIRSNEMPRARVEGILYSLTDEEVFDLDRRRGVGVQYERKRMPVYVEADGGLGQVYAFMYIGLKNHWSGKIDFEQNILKNDTVKLVDRLPDGSQLLNNRYCFLPPPITVSRTVFSPEVAKYVRTKNQREITRLRWDNFKRRLKHFLNDE